MTGPPLLAAAGGTVVAWSVAVCLAYLAFVYVAYGGMLACSLVEKRLSGRGRRFESLDLVRESPWTIPVSIVAPVFNEEPVVAAAVASFLAVDYPEFEVIVVDDGSSDGTLDALRRAFELEQTERFYRRILDSQPVRAIYVSRAHPRLVVVEKENGGKADALNAGLNFARYRYVCGVDGDTLLAPTALLDGMRRVLADPGRVIGVTGLVAISGRPEASLGEAGRPCRVDRRPLLAFQHLDYLRSFFDNRLGWTRLNTMLCAVGAFQIWRRDVLEEVNGFSTAFTCEDIELTFRVHEKFRREGREYEILSLPETVGVTEGPDRVRRLVAQRERWQRVIMETVVHYRKMFLNPRYGAVGLVGVPFFVLSEVTAPLFELLALSGLLAGLALGVVDVERLLLMSASIAFANAVLTVVAVMLDDQTARAYRRSDLLRLVVLAPLDLLAYRPLIVYARAKGTWRFLRRDHGWHKFERNERAPSS